MGLDMGAAYCLTILLLSSILAQKALGTRIPDAVFGPDQDPDPSQSVRTYISKAPANNGLTKEGEFWHAGRMTYYCGHEPHTWFQAALSCLNKNMMLAMPKTEKVSKMISNRCGFIPAGETPTELNPVWSAGYWVGARKVGDVLKFSDGTSVKPEMWFTGEPNARDTSQEICVQSVYHFDDDYCTKERFYVCQRRNEQFEERMWHIKNRAKVFRRLASLHEKHIGEQSDKITSPREE